MNKKLLLMMALFFSGCSGYEFSDTVQLADKVVTKHSIARGLVHKPQMPHHEKTNVERNEISAGGTINPGDAQKESGIWILYPIGAAALIAGLVGAVFFKRYLTGVAGAIAGLAVILAGGLIENYPWVLLLLPVGALGAAGWFILDCSKRKKICDGLEFASKALKQTVCGFENVKQGLSAETRREMNKAISATQDQDVQQKIKQVKMGLGPTG